jgi:hypothetical protein
VGRLSGYWELFTKTQTGKESPLSMRLRKRDFTTRVNGDVTIEFGEDRLTSFAGLELLGRYVRRLDFAEALREAFRKLDVGGDYGVVSMIRVILALLWVGGRRLSHIAYVKHDPMFGRLVQLSKLPDERTLSRWLKRFRAKTVVVLSRLNAQVVWGTVRDLSLRRATIDLDGTVVCAGLQVMWARRGYNPHHRKVPSYYPIVAHVGQTGQVLKVKNRPGNVNDGTKAELFIREIVREARREIGEGVRLEFRMDGAFFKRPVLVELERRGVEYGMKVPIWPWVGLKPLIQGRRRWRRLNGEISYFETTLPLDCWEMDLRVVVYRKRVWHRSPKNYQLDLFDPNDGHYEYQAATTNKQIGAADLWRFMAGRGAQEKTIEELKNGFAFDSVPTNHYGANSAWQQLSALSLNLFRCFQIEAGAARRPRSRKRTFAFTFESIKSARFKWLTVAGRFVRTDGRMRLRLVNVPAVRRHYDRIEAALATA